MDDARNRDQEGPAAGFPRALQAGFWLCLAIAVAAVLRRLATLATPPRLGVPPQLAMLDAFFTAHAALTLVHILTALVFVLLLPFLFWSRTRGAPFLARAIYPLGVVVGLTAYGMSAHPVGGWIELSAVLFFNTLFLFALLRAFLLMRLGKTEAAQPWLLRAVAILLGIATTRPVMGVFFATARLTHLTPRQFFGIAFWIGFSINTVVIEIWLRRRGILSARSLA